MRSPAKTSSPRATVSVRARRVVRRGRHDDPAERPGWSGPVQAVPTTRPPGRRRRSVACAPPARAAFGRGIELRAGKRLRAPRIHGRIPSSRFAPSTSQRSGRARRPGAGRRGTGRRTRPPSSSPGRPGTGATSCDEGLRARDCPARSTDWVVTGNAGTGKSSPARAMHARSRTTTRRRGSGRAARSGRRAPAWTASPSTAVPGGDLEVVERLVQAAPHAVGGGRPCGPARPRGRRRAQSSAARPGWRGAGRVRG